VARTELGISSLEDLKGLRFGFVDEHSASGYLYPLGFLISGGLGPQRNFREIVFTGRHDSLMSHLIAGRIDAGATSPAPCSTRRITGSTWSRSRSSPRRDASRTTPGSPREQLHPSVVAKLRAACSR
jgi:ABC-type phosphate/phosphonate transport system substrate-binding protein